jgi:H+/Cl- antiporter ClcA
LFDLFAAILIGVTTGLLGSFFIYAQTKMTKLRKLYINTNLKKILEGLFFAFVTAAGFYLAVLLTHEDCLTAEKVDSVGRMNEEFRFYCPEGTYNPLAALFFNTEGGTIRQFMLKP